MPIPYRFTTNKNAFFKTMFKNGNYCHILVDDGGNVVRYLHDCAVRKPPGSPSYK